MRSVKTTSRKTYKRLNLSFIQINQEICDEIALLPGLEKVRFSEHTGIYSLLRLINLKKVGSSWRSQSK